MVNDFLTKYPIDPQKPIETVDELAMHLLHAAQLEMSTIPLYLYPAYSIQTRGYSQWDPGVSAFRAIRSVVIEEMLHLALARNLMVAIGCGDRITFYDKDFVPKYPSPMLHRIPTLMLNLEPCSQDLMKSIFMPLELPEKTDAPPEGGQYHTIGQFYKAIQDGFDALDGPELWKHNRPELQYSHAYWNNDGGGSPVVVTDLESAKEAILTIVEQGEGIDPDRGTVPIDPTKPTPGLDELSHYAKFKRIADGIDKIGVVYPVPTNPRAADLQTEGSASKLIDLFNAAYCFVLCILDEIYSASSEDIAPGNHSRRYGLERQFIAAMGGLLYPIADLLVHTPLSPPAGGTGREPHLAPTFEFYPFPEDQSKKRHLTDLCNKAIVDFPTLGGDNSVRWLISRMPDI